MGASLGQVIFVSDSSKQLHLLWNGPVTSSSWAATASQCCRRTSRLHTFSSRRFRQESYVSKPLEQIISKTTPYTAIMATHGPGMICYLHVLTFRGWFVSKHS